MSGQIILGQKLKIKSQKYKSKVKSDDKPENSHTRVIIKFCDGLKLLFNDQRKFGWIKIVDRQQVTVDSLLQKFGPEPLEKGFTWQILKSLIFKYKSLPVKQALMDQSIVAGIGNIYASEACFLAKIDPKTKVKDLTDEQLKRLHKGIISSLETAIQYKGSTKTHFVDSQGNKGEFLDHAFVYNREDLPCKICSYKIKKIKLGGRGTYFCPKCQK